MLNEFVSEQMQVNGTSMTSIVLKALEDEAKRSKEN